MEWPKLKNIILAILAMTNLCLFFFVATGSGSSITFRTRPAATRWPFWPACSITVDRTFSLGTRDALPP